MADLNHRPPNGLVAHAALLAIALYLVAVPLASVGIERWSGHDLARAAQVALGLACALACVGQPPPWPRWATAPLAAGAALALAAVLMAPLPAMALRELALSLGLIAVVALIATVPGTARIGLRVVVVVATALYVTVILLIVITVIASGSTPSRIDLFIGYDNLRFYNHVQTVAMPLTLAAAAWPGLPRAWRWMAAWAGVGNGVLLFVAAGRGTFIALVVAAVVVLGLVGRRAWPVVRRLALVLAAGAALFALLFLVWPWWAHGTQPPMADYGAARLGSDQSRLYLWHAAWQQILQAPWLGVGPMHYAHIPNAKAAHPHNVVLQVAAEWGLPMALLCIATATGLFAKLIQAVRRQDLDPASGRVGMALALGCVAVAADGLVSGNFVMPVSQVWIAVLVGCSLAWWRQHGAAHKPGVRSMLPGRVAAVLVLVSQLWLVVQVAPEVLDLPAHLQQTMEHFPRESMQPRFWSIGRF
jgi:O-antigen ligase